VRVIVFGGKGFLGSHVVDELKARGHEVRVFDLKTGVNILCPESWDVSGVDVIYNFAGIADINHTCPRDTLETNIIGNYNILEAAKKTNIKRFVFASTAYVFSKKGSYYGISKQAAERCVEESGIPYTILRYGSVYGPRSDKSNRVFRMVEEAVMGKHVTVPGTGSAIREYIHVRDAAKLSVDILTPDHENKHIMLTGTEKLSHFDLAELIQGIVGYNGIAFDKPFASHYEKTPYSFSPNASVKLTANPSVDMGQGLLEMVHEVYERIRSKS
jgi:UDP-glucose 4-epimerase